MRHDSELETRLAPLPATVKADAVWFWLAATGALGVIIGAVGPWATAWGVAELSGTDMHGWREVAIGVIALALLALHRWRGGALVLALVAVDGAIGALGALAALADLNENSTLSVLGFEYRYLHPAWGLYLVLVGALVLCGCACALAWRTWRDAR